MEYDHKEFPKSVGAKDYWRQVKRTVNGEPVSNADIELIVNAIRNSLALKPGGSDYLLDIGCGNGALTAFFYDSIEKMLGVDFSEYLIAVAKRDFQIDGKYEYIVDDADSFLERYDRPESFNKVLLYGCLSYFPDTEKTLTLIRNRFMNVERVFIGNMPDLSRVDKFYYQGIPDLVDLKNPESKIGIWRTPNEFSKVALAAGWHSEFQYMPIGFYSSHYRYDVLLTPV